ncbi:protein DA1-like [Andrographis paniculata]|uniref:protein DA1-like n=1 Tax=Andrographis paniculata TaxID=175694 RepID=UPI0021E819BB|nr:protein DA1-like [Andrographis paniculata]XP_051123611.1 protein DA1-like [Andrographis paniculata]XP_051123613.1 protein DA1-like [Andrographis paniculata]XP_051123614.1 protein DA1-like [Andrographis paniculata]XP_051123615.1 protein DA1-like [Andrographis paniculata]XP_051123616.1 protein DA1-like [Andrographis paniculata]XP_051123617.1 protein DA1-like [Andrographis paniculata]XP_051123618.1 protein DA1-like [Andrographis paniculata]
MSWFSKIFKGSNHRLSEGRYDWRYGDDTSATENPPSNTSWDSVSENEDIDHAIALSLAEEEQRRNAAVDSEQQLEEDERIARALQERLNIEPPPEPEGRSDAGAGNVYGNGYVPGYGNDALYQPVPYPYYTTFRLCSGCNTEIGHGRFLSCMNGFWHPECFRCHGCGNPISDHEFSMSGSYPYHRSCYRESYHPKCDICNHFIPMNAAGLIEYRQHPFWAQKYCPCHEHDGTPRCCSCERMESWDSRYASLNDGRKLCLECLDTAIMDTDECQPLFVDIQEFYEGLNMKVTQQIPLLLVERQALNEAMDGERHGHHHMPETRGLCLSEEQTISTVLRRPRAGGRNRAAGMRTEPYRLTRHCEVTAILILYGLPRLLTGSILAHEMMHAWLRLNGFRTLRQDVEEGICQVMASMWLESQILNMSDSDYASTSSSPAFPSSRQQPRSPLEKKLSVFFKHQIASDTSVVYGDGFRAGNQAVLKYGLQRTLDHMRETGNFPF